MYVTTKNIWDDDAWSDPIYVEQYVFPSFTPVPTLILFIDPASTRTCSGTTTAKCT
jgi:hypothetical protein